VRERYRCSVNDRWSPGVPVPHHTGDVLKLWRPNEAWLRDLAEREHDQPFTYEPVGASATDDWPSGFRHDHWEVELGTGDETFERAVAGLQHWLPQRGSGFAVGFDGLVEPGRTVAIAAPLPIGFVIVTARIIYVEAEADRYAWAYGTLPIHPEVGEERFAIVRHDDAVHFEITAFSKVTDPLGRLVPPIARALQVRANRAYLDAMVANQRSSAS
jgi:uncharacterized protein (UPF0548 family)